MNKRHLGILIIGIIFLAVMTVVGVTKCAHENDKAHMLWPEGRVITR